MGSVRELTGPVLYEQIGTNYMRARRTEPRIAEQIWSALGDAESVLNVGAGTGSYEPPDRKVLAVEPSRSMRAQRPSGAARCIDASAEALPFSDQSFDATMAVLSDHHWSDPIAGLLEMRRETTEPGRHPITTSPGRRITGIPQTRCKRIESSAT
jgi:SAM-dependent methyltransferase